MTTDAFEHIWSRARPSVERVFQKAIWDSWDGPLADAAHWLGEKANEDGKFVYVYLASSVRLGPLNRLSRYYKVSKIRDYENFFKEPNELVFEKLHETDGKGIFNAIVRLPVVEDKLLAHPLLNGFMFLSDTELSVADADVLLNAMYEYTSKFERPSVDAFVLLEVLRKFDLSLVRTHYSNDNTDFTLEFFV